MRFPCEVLALGLLAGAHQAAAADGLSVAGLSKRLTIEESRGGATNPNLLPLLDRLASAQFDSGALGEAAESRRRALKIALRAFGGNSTNAATAMVAVSDVELLRQRYAEAEPLLTASLVVLTSKGGAASPALIQPLAELARIALARGEVAAAERLADRANAIPALNLPGSTEPLRVLGAVYAEQRRFDDGERVLRAALARDRQARAPAETARSLAQLANLLLRAERFGEALPLIEEAIAIDQEHLGATHPLIADDYADLGLIYAGLGRDVDASVALYFAIDVLDRGAGGDTPRVAYAELELSTVLRRLGQTDDADAAFDDAKQILDSAADHERQHERQL